MKNWFSIWLRRLTEEFLRFRVRSLVIIKFIKNSLCHSSFLYFRCYFTAWYLICLPLRLFRRGSLHILNIFRLFLHALLKNHLAMVTIKLTNPHSRILMLHFHHWFNNIYKKNALKLVFSLTKSWRNHDCLSLSFSSPILCSHELSIEKHNVVE